MYYIRFTTDIHSDIERGHSFDFRTKKSLSGLCAWAIKGSELTEQSSDEEIIAAAREFAVRIAKNTYSSYTSENEFAVLVGRYAGNSNDGSLIKVERVISTENLC